MALSSISERAVCRHSDLTLGRVFGNSLPAIGPNREICRPRLCQVVTASSIPMPGAMAHLARQRTHKPSWRREPTVLHAAAYVGPASHEVLAPAEQDLHGMPDQAEAIRYRFGGRRPAIHLLGTSHPAQDRVVVCAHQLEPVIDAGLDGLFADFLDHELGHLQSSDVELEWTRCKEHAVTVGVMGRKAVLIIQASAIGRVPGICPDQSFGHLVDDPYGLVEDPLIGPGPRVPNISRVDECGASRAQ